MGFRSAILKDLHDRKLTDDQIRALGGVIQADGLNVCFAAGENYDKVAALLKLKPLPKRTTPQEAVKKWLKENGPKLWANWHTDLQTVPITEKDLTELSQGLVNSLPGSNCGCKKKTKKLLKERPAPITNRREVQDWGYWLHNQINVKLKKPEIPIDQCRLIWENNANGNTTSTTGTST